MNYLSVENLGKHYGERLLFENVSFGIDKGQKVALVAKNGTGKTTLLNILIGNDVADQGKVTLRNDIRVGYLPQLFDSNYAKTVFDAVFDQQSPQVNAIKEYDAALAALKEKDTLINHDRLERAMEQMDVAAAWDFDAKAKEMLHRFDIANVFQNVCELSGGQRKKIALVKLLLSDADFIILDEPINHLDVEMIEWLENYLSTANTTLLMVTHDRFFLNKVCNEILEMSHGEMFRYRGRYDYYLEKKAEREVAQLAEIERYKNLYRTELEWMRSTPQARSTKAKARIDNFESIKEKAFEKVEQRDRNFAVKTERIGNKILEINHIEFSFDDKLIVKDFSYIFKKGERCGIVGKNGSGKTTILKLIVNELKPTKGKITVGETIIMGYYSQDGLSDDNKGKRVIDIVKEHAEMVRMANGNLISASAFLNHFGFTFEHQYTFFENLSGGQRRKLYLLMVLLKNPNFLILDEPTNDFDIDTLNILEDFLSTYQGCLLVVSHDRWFLDKLVDHIFVLQEDATIKDYYGNYSDYKTVESQKQKSEKRQVKAEKVIETKPKNISNVEKRTYKEEKEYVELEQEIEQLEQKKASLLALFNDEKASSEQLVEASQQYTIIDQAIEEKTMRWLVLSEKAPK